MDGMLSGGEEKLWNCRGKKGTKFECFTKNKTNRRKKEAGMRSGNSHINSLTPNKLKSDFHLLLDCRLMAAGGEML